MIVLVKEKRQGDRNEKEREITGLVTALLFYFNFAYQAAADDDYDCDCDCYCNNVESHQQVRKEEREEKISREQKDNCCALLRLTVKKK